MMATPKPAEESCAGIDIFVESTAPASSLAAQIRPLVPPGLNLTLISNRATEVWPRASPLTACVNHDRVRLERAPEAPAPRGAALLQFAAAVDAVARVCSTELLLQLGDRKGYSLAQGQ